MSNQIQKYNVKKFYLAIVAIIVIVVGAFVIWQKNRIPNDQEEEILANSQKASDKYSQLLVWITDPGQEGDGDIITIGGETHEWGRMEKIKFLIVAIPVLSKEEKIEFMKQEDGKKVYRVAYEKFLSPEEIAKIKAQKEGLDKYILIKKGDIVKK